jgi:hypothetical protein
VATASGISVFRARGVIAHTWVLTNTATVGRPATLVAYPDKTVQVRGTFGAGGTVVICGSNQSATVAQASLTTGALSDSRGEANPLTVTTANILQVLENPNLIYPKLTVASGSTSLTVTVVAQSTRR